MGKSFVFKDQSGAVRGYLVQGMGKLRCRADALTAEGQLVLLYADGASSRHALTAGGAEQTLPDGGRTIDGAVVCAGGEPLLRTDERASAAYAQLFRRKEYAGRAPGRQNERGIQQKTEPEEECEKNERQSKEEREELREERESPHNEERDGSAESLPQRRWPPPACWPGAQYVHGRWQERDE